MNQPLFSILIANFNNGCFLQEAIDSIFAQTYSNWEVIIVDDKSTDMSFELYEKYSKDSRFHIFYNDKNRGCGYTKRYCAEVAHGDICGFLDPDDVLLPDALLSHVKVHSEKPEISCVFSRYYKCDECLNIINKSRQLHIAPENSYFTNRDYSVEAFASYKKDCYNRTEGIYNDIKAAVDQDLYFKLEEVAPIFVLDKITYKYRVHANSVSNKPTNEDVYWNLIVRHRTCIRRKLDPSEYPVKDFIRYSACLFNEGADKVRLSSTYRLGKALLKPLSLLRK